MTPMCDVDTGEQLGWAIAVAACDGDVTLEYFDVDGVSEGGSLPADWKPCIQGVPGAEASFTHTDLAYSGTVDISFTDADYYSIDDVSGNLTLTGSDYGSAREVAIRLVETGGSSRTFTPPSGWKWVGSTPTFIGANETVLIRAISFTAAGSGVVASWETT